MKQYVMVAFCYLNTQLDSWDFTVTLVKQPVAITQPGRQKEKQ